MRKYIGFLLVMMIAGLTLMAQQDKPEPKPAPGAEKVVNVPADATHLANPVKPSAESIASGKKYYGYDCAMCHGETGDGKGEVAVAEGYNLKDFRDPESLRSRTDGDMFYILKKGHGKMPAEPVRVNENELWNLVNYVRSLAVKTEKK
jgi:mono/diheme cytochrome c family protein